MRIPDKPFVVLDWNWIQTLPAAREHLPSGCCYVLGDTALTELAGKSEAEVAGLSRKLRRIVQLNADRIFVGRYWEEVSRSEASPQALSTVADIIEPKYTTALRELAFADDSDWDRGVNDARAKIGEDQSRQLAFVNFCKDWTNWITAQDSDGIRRYSSLKAQTEWIRTPEQVVELIARFSPRFNTPEWRMSLGVFPDRLASGRWGRAVIWYCLMHSVGDVVNFENNWHDAAYGFLSSYTGYLATNDRKLQKMVKAVFPNVQSWLG